MNQLRILVFSAGFGNGHFRAAEAIIEGIRNKQPDAEIIHLDFGDFLSKRINSMAKNVYFEMIRHTPKLWGKFYYQTSKVKPESSIQRFLNQLGRNNFLNYIQSFAPDLIVCTYPTISSVLAQLRLEKILQVPVITIITDYTVHSHWVHSGVDRYIVACDEVKECLMSRGIYQQNILVTGIPVSPKFEVNIDREAISSKLGLNPKLPTYLVMVGGFWGIKSAKRICRTLAASLIPVQFMVVCGNNFKLYQTLKKIKEQSLNPMLLFGYVHDIEELMSVSNLIITKAGGLTVSEALTKCLPLLIYKAIPGQEEANAYYIQRLGAGYVSSTERNLLQILTRFLANPQEIDTMREMAAVAIKSHSTERAVNALLQIVFTNKTQQKTG